MTRIPLPTKTRVAVTPASADETLAYYTALPNAGSLREISPLEQMYGYYRAE